MHHSVTSDADAALLDILTGPNPKVAKASFARRDAALDPLLIAAAAASGPQVTRNHYHHDFFPGVMMPQAEGAWDWTKYTGDDASSKGARKRLAYVSRQAPRKHRVLTEDGKENDQSRATEPLKPADNLPHPSKNRRPSVVSPTSPNLPDAKLRPKSHSNTDAIVVAAPPSSTHVEVKCMARTRIPTPHGPAFLHLYHNTRDNKEHLAIVIDPAQLSETPDSHPIASPIRSQSLDAVWSDTETEMDRIVRGAYTGRLSSTSQRASHPSTKSPHEGHLEAAVPPPIIRIHSECFTGETIGSMRCDCGEQLDEAIRQISLPITLPPTPSNPIGTRIPGRGAVIYMRQEGRGIGLLSKIRAYNLQDMGHDTVTANLMLGHKADERGYEVAAAILRDLGLGWDASRSAASEGVRVLTNNPDKVQALEKEGINISERVPMIPRSWQQRKAAATKTTKDTKTTHVHDHAVIVQSDLVDGEFTRIAGATLVGGGAVHGEDLDKYLRTKVMRMGHMLPLWMEEQDVRIY